MLDSGALEGDTIGAHEIGVGDVVILGVEIADGHVFVPDNVGIGGLGAHAGNDGGNYYPGYEDDTNDSKCFFHVTPFS